MTFLVSPIATVATQRYVIRKTMFVGVVLETASLFLASLATSIWHLFLTQGVLFGIGLGMMFIPIAAVVPQWFTKKRSLASGVAVSGAGLGGLVYSLVAEALIRNLGLTWAFRILGITAFTVNMCCVLLIRDRRRLTKVSFAKAAVELSLFKNIGFDLLIGFSGFTIFGYFILIFSLAAYGVSIGLHSSQASLVSGLLNLGQAIGRPLTGYFSDSIGRIKMAGVATFLAGVICLAVWITAKSYGLLIFFALTEGIVAGNFWATIAPLVAEVMGLEKVPSGMNVVWLSIVLPSTFSEPIALRMKGAPGSYPGSQLFSGLMYIAASACLGLLFLRQKRQEGWSI
ncbi:putative transporter MCH2 [Exophiala dermatitidis]